MWYQQGGLHVTAKGALLGVQHGQYWWDTARVPTGAYFAEQWDYGEEDPGWCAITGADIRNAQRSCGGTAFGKHQCLSYYWYFTCFLPEKS